MNNLKVRTFTGVAIVLIITTLIKSGFYGFLLLVLMIDIEGLAEFYRLSTGNEMKPLKVEGILFSLVIVATFWLWAVHNYNYKVLLINIPLVFLLFMRELYQKQKQPFVNLALTFTGIIYITLPLIAFIAVAFYPLFKVYQLNLILGYFMILWAADSGAYLIGRLLGKHKLFERISPGKTWEGYGGGVLSASIVAYINADLFDVLALKQWLIIAVIVSVTGTYGDLFKSMLKRSAKVKDAGNILPGHGGVLDRFDSLLGSVTFVYGFLLLNQNVSTSPLHN